MQQNLKTEAVRLAGLMAVVAAAKVLVEVEHMAAGKVPVLTEVLGEREAFSVEEMAQ